MRPNKTILLALLVLIACLAIWFLSHRPPNPNAPQPVASETNQAGPLLDGAPATRVASVPSAHSGTVPLPQNNAAPGEDRRKQMDEPLEKAHDRWRTPIEFYGKVVDENTNPVAGAQVNFDCNDTSAEGTSFYHTQSDANGLFSIRGIRGMLLGVKVNKEGYYPYLPFGDNFYYAGRNQNFVPNASSPVVFRLKKKGIAEPLIVLDRNFQISISGKPLELAAC